MRYMMHSLLINDSLNLYWRAMYVNEFQILKVVKKFFSNIISYAFHIIPTYLSCFPCFDK